MSKLIKPLPDIPEKLREAAQRGVLVPFIGAGASCLAGCPDWECFATQALHFIVEKTAFTYAQLAQIEPLNPRVKLSIAQIIADKHSLDIDYRKILLPPYKGYENPKGCRLYGTLNQLGKSFVTTNFDEWLDYERTITGPASKPAADASSAPTSIGKKREKIYKVEDIIPVALEKPGTVIHLHGSVLEPREMVMTTGGYIRHYANDRQGDENRILTFLEHLFDNKTVLFIGYALQEMEILEYVIQKSRQELQAKGKITNHFILLGFFSHEVELMEAQKLYYLEECGIEVIPFSRDDKDWDQLLHVLDHFVEQIPAQEPSILEKKVTMEGLLDD